MTNKNNRCETFFLRVLELGITTQAELAGFLGTTSSAVSDAKKKKTIPNRWVSELSQQFHKSPEWLLGIETAPGQNAEDIKILKSKVKILEEEISFLKSTKFPKKINRIVKKVTWES